MQIRLADPDDVHDLQGALRVDDSFETDYVWQMEEQNRPGLVNVSFRLTRLPRPMRVTDLIKPDDVVRNVKTGASLFLAEEAGIQGFLDIAAVEWNQSAYINNFAVAPAYRRRGTGTALLRAALEWARAQKLRAAMLDTSTKDYPAICFYQKHGFQLCGYNDQIYPNRDIALYFCLNLR